MHIEKFRQMIIEHDFRCLEIHDRLSNEVLFRIMTDDSNKTIGVNYNRDECGILGFDKASIIQGNFDFSFGYIESMLLCGQCSYIKYYRGSEVVKLPNRKE
jgi:hypothetical protein